MRECAPTLPEMDEVRIRDSSISKNIDLYLEELKREQEAREQQNAERDRSENDRPGNGAMNLDEREGAGEENEEDWEEEYLMLDLDDVFHGASVPSFGYTLSGLDTLNPILTLDNGLKLIGHYVETIGTAVVYSEKEKEVEADRWDLPPPPPPADSNATNKEKRPLKRIQGVCKLERKLKFCAMPIACAPARKDTSAGESARPPEDASPENAGLTEDELLGNHMPIYNHTSAESAELGEDVTLETMRPAEEDALLENARSMEDASLGNARPEVNTALEYARAVEGVSLENALLTEETSK